MFEVGAGFDLGTPGDGWAPTYSMILRVESAWRSPIYVRAELGIGTYLGAPSDPYSTSPDWNSRTGVPYINVKIEPITWTGKDDLFEENSKRTVVGMGFLPTEITRDMATGEELTVKAAFANFMMRTENKTRREEDFKIFFRFATHLLGAKYQELVRHSFDNVWDEEGDYENHRSTSGFGLSVGTATMEGGFRVQPAEWIAFKVTAGASGDLTLSADLPVTSFQSFVMGRAQFLGFWEAFVKYQYSVMDGDYEGTHFSVGVGRNF